jgi:hypothetical protein
MPQCTGGYLVSGGSLLQVDESGPYAVCYVEVDIPANGSRTVTVTLDTTDASPRATAPVLRLDPGQPNPFNPLTDLSFSLPRATTARLSIYDLRGREVRVLIDSPQPSGEQRVRWDGRDRHGKEVPSGVYLARLAVDGEVRTQKLVLAR